MQRINVPAMTSATDEKIMAIAQEAKKILGGRYPQYVCRVLELCLPPLQKAPGACALLPDGLPQIPNLCASQIEALIADMNATKIITDKGATKNAKPPKVKKPNAKSKGGKKMKGSQELIPDELELDDNADYLGHLESTKAYLMKIDDRQQEVVSAMDMIGVYSVLMGGVELQVKGHLV